jgi:hypothetical protein
MHALMWYDGREMTVLALSYNKDRLIEHMNWAKTQYPYGKYEIRENVLIL